MILDDIQQKRKFISERHKAMVNIQFTHSWVHDKVKRFLRPSSVTPQQLNILRILRTSGDSMSTMQIREKMLEKMSDISRLVDRLVKKGFAEKASGTADKRLVNVIITSKGLECLQGIEEKNEELEGIAGGITNDEAIVLNELLLKLRHPDLAKVEKKKEAVVVEVEGEIEAVSA